MKAKKLIRYRLAVSRNFPATHPRKGEPTYFVEKIRRNIDCKKCPHELCDNCGLGDVWNKLHTIRGNYGLWAKRFEKINKGEAVLELYYWSGKPYNSKCVTVCQLGKEDGIGLQKATLLQITHDFKDVQKNDGLAYCDFMDWFSKAPMDAELAIIHFTKFRY